MKLLRFELVVFLAAGTALSWRLWNIGIASGYVDPALRLGAQDEAVYTREAITMAREGGWMTPTFLGRWVFEKPPLLVWLSALSMKLFGIGRLPARLPSVLAVALPAIWTALRRRDATAVLVAGGALVYFTAFMIFRFHSEQYLTWFVPWLILLAAVYSPALNGRRAWIAAAVCLGTFVIHAARLGYYRSGNTIAAAPVLERYCEERRAADLYILGVDDEFYSAVLPLKRVRYGFVDPADLAAREHPDLAHLGILIPAAGFAAIDTRRPLYAQRLRNRGLHSTRPVGTAITARDSAGLRRLIAAHPESDFLVSRAILPEPEKDALHRVALANADFALLESRAPESQPSAGAPRQPAWSCRM